MRPVAVLRWLTVLGIVLGLTFAALRAQADEISFARGLRLARDRAAEMRAARAKLATADAQLTLARAPYLPSLIATGSGIVSAARTVTGGFVPGTSTSVVYT